MASSSSVAEIWVVGSAGVWLCRRLSSCTLLGGIFSFLSPSTTSRKISTASIWSMGARLGCCLIASSRLRAASRILSAGVRIGGIPNSRTPLAWTQVNYRASATTSFRFHGAPRPRHGIARSARPGRRSHPPSQECRTSTYYHRNTTLPRLRSSRSAALTANGPPLAWRCRRRRHRDRWTPRRRFQVRSACPRGAANGPRPG